MNEIVYFHQCTVFKLYLDVVLEFWIPFGMVMMWVEVLLSVGAQCDEGHSMARQPQIGQHPSDLCVIDYIRLI